MSSIDTISGGEQTTFHRLMRQSTRGGRLRHKVSAAPGDYVHGDDDGDADHDDEWMTS